MKSVFVSEHEQVDIPGWVIDFNTFRRWLHSEGFPNDGRIGYIQGSVWVDLSMERFFEHGQVKTEVCRVLANLMKETRWGRFAPDGTRYSHLKTRLSTEPDGLVISHKAFASGRVKLISGKKGKDTELVGSPEIAIEVVSPSSADKDTEWLMAAYHNAGVDEYWLFDVREGVRFDIYRLGKRGYSPSRKLEGWVRSPILGKSFRLVRTEDTNGDPEYTLELR